MQKQVDFSKANNTKFPEQLVIAIAKDKLGKANPITVGWTMPVSRNPDMMAIVINSTRYSVEAIQHSKSFTIVFPSDKMADETLFFGTKSGRNMDKLKESGIAYEDTSKINSVILTDAVANFECELESEIIKAKNIIFIGEIVASHINTKPKKRLYTLGTEKGYQLGGVL